MSADMVIVCKEDDSIYEGKGRDKAFFIDETSMGEPHHAFGKWFGKRYCKAPSLLEQVFAGKHHSNHDYIMLTMADYSAIKKALLDFESHEDLNKENLLTYIRKHIGKHISTECW